MDKAALLKRIVEQLTSELEIYFRAARAAHAEATHEQSKAENKYDTRGLEASYLARGQSRQAAELQNAISEFEKLGTRSFEGGTPIDVGALVEVQQKSSRALYFIGPKAGGTEVVHDGSEILVITPQSPLGAQLQGRKQGERLKLSLGGRTAECRIVSVS